MESKFDILVAVFTAFCVYYSDVSNTMPAMLLLLLFDVVSTS